MSKNYPIATEILREEIRRKRFWLTAFIVTLIVTAVREIERKWA